MNANYQIRIAAAFLFSINLLCGCDKAKENEKGETKESTDVTQINDSEPDNGSGYLEQANELFKKAKDAGQTTAANAGEWIGDKFSGAMDATGSVAQDTGDWVTETFESLKNQGMTTANNATEWVQEDLQNMSAFEYKVISKEGNGEQALNELGKQRWECFAVDDQSFYLKRQSKSYLRHVPVKDLLKFLPAGGDGG